MRVTKVLDIYRNTINMVAFNDTLPGFIFRFEFGKLLADFSATPRIKKI